MTAPGFVEAYRSHEFVVEIEGITSPGITKVSGLTDGEIDAIEQPDGGANHVHKISSGLIKYGDVTLERHMDGTQTDADFLTWFSEMFYLDGRGTLHRNGAIRKLRGTDEALFYDMALNGAELVTQLIHRSLVRLEGLDRIEPALIDQLYCADRNYLLLELRRATFGDALR